MADLSIGTTIGGFAAYHAGNYFPDKTTVGLGSVNNWGASDSYTTASSTTYATSAAVKGAYDAAMAAIGNVTELAWGNITGKPSTFPPSAHTHAVADVTGLQAELGRKINAADVSSANTWAALIGKIPQIKTDGVLEIARFLNFHTTNSTADFDFRFDSPSNGNLNGYGSIDLAGAMVATRLQAKSGNAIVEYHNPGVIAYSHAISGDTLETWQSSGAGGWITTFNRQYPNGAYWINGNIWAANFNHAYAGQPGIMAPITVDMGVVSGASDYYPMIRQLSVSSGYGYSTRVELGTLRSGNSAWGVGNLIVGSHESSSHPSAIYAFDISGNFTAPGNVTAYSDERLKKNLEVIPDALAKLDSVRCMTFDRVDRELRQAGVIAQDIQQVLPEAVQVDQEGYLTVAYGALVALAIKAIQELKQRVEDLERNG